MEKPKGNYEPVVGTLKLGVYTIYWKHPETRTYDYLDSFIYAKNKSDAIDIVTSKVDKSYFLEEYLAPKKADRNNMVIINYEVDYLGNNARFFINGDEILKDWEKDGHNYDYLVDLVQPDWS